MAFTLKYINVFDDINSQNFEELAKFYRSADIQVENGIKPPEYNTVERVASGLRLYGMSKLSEETMLKHIKASCKISDDAAKILCTGMEYELSLLVPNKNAIQSNYVKIVCWLKTEFSCACLGDKSIFVRGKLGKYEIYTLYLLSKLGNNIVVVDEQYDKAKYAQYNNINHNVYGTNEKLSISNSISLTFEDAIKLLETNGEGTETGSKTIILGTDNYGKLDNSLYSIYANTPSNVLLLVDGLIRPTYDELKSSPKYTAQTISGIINRLGNGAVFSKYPKYADKALKYVQEMLGEYSNVTQASNTLTEFICLYNRLDLSKQIFVSYQKISKIANMYLSFLSHIGKTVIVVDQSGKSKDSEYADGWNIIELDEYIDEPQYPKSPVVNTIAYNASQEINDTLFNGENLGLYRDMQFKKCKAVEMRTTFDELQLLWGQDNQLRSQFTTTRDTVVVPVIFAELLGVPDNYKSVVSKLMVDNSIVINGIRELDRLICRNMVIEHGVSVNGIPFNEQKPIVVNGEISVRNTIASKNYTYKHLSEAVSIHIVSKIKEMVENGLIRYDGMAKDKFIDKVLNIGLNFTPEIQQRLQSYDYVKRAPKLIVYANTQDIITLDESILLALLHLCGWDIVVLIPTGYNVLGGCLRGGLVQQHIIGEMKFDVELDHLRTEGGNVEKKGFFSRLFSGL